MGLTINYENRSGLVWVRDNWHIGAGESSELNWADELTNQPKDKLEPKLDSTSAAAHSAQFSSMVEDALWMILGFGSPQQGSIAIRVQQNMHVAGYGAQATWQLWDNGWQDKGTDATPYKWTFASTWAIATPTLSNEDAGVAVAIWDLRDRG
jgi:hypothetical protein